jgi:hypothetical protein
MKCRKVIMATYYDHELEMALAYCAYKGVSLTWVKADGSTVKSKALWRSRAMLVFKQLQDNPAYGFTQGLSLRVSWTKDYQMVISCVQRQEPKAETLESITARIKECLTVGELRTILKGFDYLADATKSFLYEIGKQAVAENRRKFNLD